MPEAVYSVTDPATGALVEEYPTASDQAVEDVLAAAQAVRSTWAHQHGVAERAQLLHRVAELHHERSRELAEIIRREMGKPVADGVGEIEFAASIYAYYADNAERFLADEVIEQADGTAVIRRQAIGSLLGVMPWNFPYYQVARFAAPNLVLGNTVILKPAPQCPRSAEALEQLFLDAGLPVGAYQSVRASNAQVAAMIADPRVAGVSFTGSERAGAEVAQQAGRHLKKVVLELGGSDPFIVLSSDDLAATASAAVAARMENVGQACNAGKRVIVLDEVYDAFVEEFTEQMLSQADSLPPLSSAAAAQRLDQQVEAAAADGGSVASKGAREGAYFPPTVITGLPAEAPSAAEEFFGPVAIVHRATSEDDAIRLANQTSYGLGSYVFSTDPKQAARVADQLEAGMVFVNGVGLDSAELPFGGIKRSGFGRELGRAAVDEFANRKLIRTVTP